MNIKNQNMQLNKKDIYEKSAGTSTENRPSTQARAPTTEAGQPKRPTEQKKVFSSYDHYYHDANNTARMPTHNYNQYLKNLLEYHNTQHDYKVLKVKVKEENEMLQDDKVEGDKEESQTTRLRGKRPEYEAENRQIQAVVKRRRNGRLL